MTALQDGRIEFVRILASAGARILEKTTVGVSPLELARENLKSEHPRIISKHGLGISQEEDGEILEVLLKELKRRQTPALAAEETIGTHGLAFSLAGN